MNININCWFKGFNINIKNEYKYYSLKDLMCKFN